jgi:hypothetical protein
METLLIESTDETPKIILDPQTGQIEFDGKSLPEDVATFYAPVLNWLDAYIENPAEKTIANFKMSYFNTASSKIILDILMKLENITSTGSDFKIKWFYQTSDSDMKEAGEEYAEILEIPFELIPF